MSEELQARKTETPFKLSQTLQQYGPEHPIDNLTQFELYGFDKPTLDFSQRETQTLNTSKAVKMLVSSGDELINYAKVFLRHVDLDAGVYDAKTNPGGIFKEPLAKSPKRGGETIIKYAVLRLLGVSKGDTHRSFGCQYVDEQLFSKAYTDAVSRVGLERESFPLLHADKFPDIQKALDKLKSLNLGINPEDIFKKGRVPRVFQWMHNTPRLDPLILPEALSMLYTMLRGETNMSEIARRHGDKSKHVVQELLGDSAKSPLTPFIQNLLRDARNKHKQQSTMTPQRREKPPVKVTRRMGRNW